MSKIYTITVFVPYVSHVRARDAQDAHNQATRIVRDTITDEKGPAPYVHSIVPEDDLFPPTEEPDPAA